MILLGMLACKTVDEIQVALEELEGVTENTIIEGLILGVEVPDIAGVSLEDIDWHTTAQATVFVADTTAIEEVDEALVEGASVFVESPDDNLKMREESGGKYLLTTEDGLDYQDNSLVSIVARLGGVPREMRVRTPPAPALPATADITALSPLDIDLTGQGYPLSMAVVFDIETGTMTWSSEPESVEAFYELAHPDGELIPADSETPRAKIPPEAFPWDGAYAIGVAGLAVSQVDDFTEVNTSLSTLMAGKFAFMAACTESHSALCAALAGDG
jgi:hypothetical protein